MLEHVGGGSRSRVPGEILLVQVEPFIRAVGLAHMQVLEGTGEWQLNARHCPHPGPGDGMKAVPVNKQKSRFTGHEGTLSFVCWLICRTTFVLQRPAVTWIRVHRSTVLLRLQSRAETTSLRATLTGEKNMFQR